MSDTARTHRILAAAIAFAGLTLAGARAEARKVEDVMAGKIVLSPRGFPRRINDAGSFLDYLRKNGTEIVDESRGKDGKPKGSWQLRYMSFFRSPLSDVTLSVKFYDLSDGGSRLVISYDLDSLDRGQRILASVITITKDDGFEPNKRYRMVVENRGQVLAETTLTLRGEGDHFSGKVSFTDAEAAGSQP